MKLVSLSSRALMAIVIFFSIGISSCDLDKFYTSLDEFNLNTDLFKVLLLLQFEDANGESGRVIDEVKLTISGPNSDLIYTAEGKQNFEVKNGMVQLSIPRREIMDTNQVLELRIVAEAENYLPEVRSILFLPNQRKHERIALFNLNDLPSGGSKANEEFPVTPAGPMRDIIITTPRENGKSEKVTVNVRAGTRLINEQGEVVAGTIKVNVYHFDNRSLESREAFPGGLTSYSVLDDNGNEIGPLHFVSAGYFTFDLSRAGAKIASFSKPIDVSMCLNPETNNIMTGKKIQPGDVIPLWRRDSETGVWRRQGNALLTLNEEGQIAANFQVTSPSFWTLAYFFPSNCKPGTPTSFNLQSLPEDIKEEENGILSLPMQILDVATGELIGPRQIIQLEDQKQISLFGIPDSRALRFQLLSSTPTINCQGSSGSSIVFDQQFSADCESNIDLDLSNLSLGDLQISNFEVFGICSSSSSQVRIYPPINLFFRPSGCSERFEWLGSGDKGEFETASLQPGLAYDFQAILGGETFSVQNVVIDSSEERDLGFAKIIISIVDGKLKVLIADVTLPDQYCEQLTG